MNVLDIVRQFLEANNYDGLYNEESCACRLSDLEPCSCMTSDCTPGYLMPCDCEENCDFHICPDKPEAIDTRRTAP